MRRLAQRVHRDGSLGVVHRLFPRLCLHTKCDQPAQRLQKRVRQPAPLRHRPVLVDPRQQFPSVQTGGALQADATLRILRRPLRLLPAAHKLGHIGCDRLWVQPDVCPICQQHRPRRHTGRLQLPPQGVEGDAQAVAPCPRVGLRPQAVNQFLARLRARQAQGQVGQQQSRLARAEAADDALALLRLQAPEQPDVP